MAFAMSSITALVVTSTAATATPIIGVVVPGDLQFTMITETADPSHLLGYDIRGTALLSVSDPGLIGGLYLTDGVVFGGPPPAFGSTVLFAFDLALTEGGVVQFGVPAFGGPGVTVTGAFSPITPLTDPALMAFAGGGSYRFGFSFIAADPFDDSSTISTWKLDSAEAVPESSSTLSLLGVGFAAMRWVRRRSSKIAS